MIIERKKKFVKLAFFWKKKQVLKFNLIKLDNKWGIHKEHEAFFLWALDFSQLFSKIDQKKSNF